MKNYNLKIGSKVFRFSVCVNQRTGFKELIYKGFRFGVMPFNFSGKEREKAQYLINLYIDRLGIEKVLTAMKKAEASTKEAA